jgi:hypothetical protein
VTGLARLASVAVGDGPAVCDAPTARLALDEQVAPLLGARVKAGTLRAEDAGASALLVGAHRECVAKSVVRDAALAPIIDAIDAAGVPMVWLKGAALVRGGWIAPGARWMGDLDVIVPRSAWRRAIDAAVGAGGVREVVPGRAITVESDYAAAIHGPRGAIIEIHRAIGPAGTFGFDVDELLASSRADGASKARIPEAAHLIVTLAAHAAKHGFAVAFRSIVDGLLLARDEAAIDLDRVVRFARASRAARATSIYLTLLHRFGAGGDWAEAARFLADDPVTRAISRGGPWRADDGHVRPWSRLARTAGALDGPLQAATFLGAKLALRVCDRVHAAIHRP